MIQDLPEIPRSWRWGTLGEVVTHIEAGKSFKCEERPPTSTELGIVKVSAVTWGTFDEEASKTCLSLDQMKAGLLISEGDFLFSRANTIQLVGACVIVHQISKRLMLSDKILRLTFRSVYPPWVLYVLRSLWGRAEIERLATGNQESMRNIGQDRIRAIRVPFPPIEEQHRIVAEIETQLTRLDVAVGGLLQARAKLKRSRASILASACGTYSQQLKGGWQTARVGDVGEVKLGRQRAPRHHTGKHMRPYLRVANVFDDRIDTSDVLEMNFTPAEFRTFQLRHGDILLNEGQSIELVGRAAMFQNEIEGACFQNTLIRFRAAESIIPRYALSVFRSWLYSGRFREVARWTTNIAHLGASRLADMTIPLPPLSEQERIVAEVEARLSKAEAVESSINHCLRRAERLRQSLLKAASLGKLNVIKDVAHV